MSRGRQSSERPQRTRGTDALAGREVEGQQPQGRRALHDGCNCQLMSGRATLQSGVARSAGDGKMATAGPLASPAPSLQQPRACIGHAGGCAPQPRVSTGSPAARRPRIEAQRNVDALLACRCQALSPCRAAAATPPKEAAPSWLDAPVLALLRLHVGDAGEQVLLALHEHLVLLDDLLLLRLGRHGGGWGKRGRVPVDAALDDVPAGGTRWCRARAEGKRRGRVRRGRLRARNGSRGALSAGSCAPERALQPGVRAER